ncbi:hypothetical protein JQM83_06915 [Parabacteroides distasonis]|nr:hypothetical protein [Parabacteroides distasonis]
MTSDKKKNVSDNVTDTEIGGQTGGQKTAISSEIFFGVGIWVSSYGKNAHITKVPMSSIGRP